MTTAMEEKYRAYSQRLCEISQAHLLAFWPQLSERERVQ